MERKVTPGMVRQAVLALLPPVEDLVGKLVVVNAADPGMEWSTTHVGSFPGEAEAFADYVVNVLGLDTVLHASQLPDKVYLWLFGRKLKLGKSSDRYPQDFYLRVEFFEPETLGSRE